MSATRPVATQGATTLTIPTDPAELAALIAQLNAAAEAQQADPALRWTVYCAIYLRISLDRNKDDLAVDRQREDCLALAKARGWVVFKVYTDRSISAYDKTKVRPQYHEMFADFKAEKFTAIICWEFDRLTRQPQQMEEWCQFGEDFPNQDDPRGLLLVSTTAVSSGDGAGRTYNLLSGEDRKVLRDKAADARADMDRKSKRQKRANKQRATNGRSRPGGAAFGYDTDGIKEDPITGPLLREVFDRFLAGSSLQSIANWLETQVPARGRKWRASSVRYLLSNPRYCGRVVYNRAAAKKSGADPIIPGVVGAWDHLVEDSDFDKVQQVLTDPRRLSNRTGTHRKYLGAGLYRCGKCGERMQSHSGDAYRCQQNACLTKGRVKVDEYVRAAVAAELARPDLGEVLTPPGLEEKVAQVEATIATLRAKLARDKALLEDEDTDLDPAILRSMQVRREKVEARLTLAYAERSTLWAGKAEHPIYASEHPDEVFLAADLGPQRQVLDELFVVTLYPGVRGKWALDPATVDIQFKRTQLAT